MLDAATCRSSRATKEATTSIAALTALWLLLSEAIAGMAVSSLEETLASRGHHRGDRHAAHPSRPRTPVRQPDLFAVIPPPGVGPGARMEQPVGSDPASGDHFDDAPIGRARHQRGARCGEQGQ